MTSLAFPIRENKREKEKKIFKSFRLKENRKFIEFWGEEKDFLRETKQNAQEND